MSDEGRRTLEANLKASKRIAEVARVIRTYFLKYERVHDERGIFAFVYFNITQDLANRLRNNSITFDDPEWVATLDESFAAQFFKVPHRELQLLFRTTPEQHSL